MSETMEQAASLRNVTAYLDRVVDEVRRVQPAVAANFETLKREMSSAPSGAEPDHLHTRLAFAVQDFTRAVGDVLPASHPLRDEMTRRATTMDGLHDPEIAGFLKQTSAIRDQNVVNKIRDVAQDVAHGGLDANHPDIAFAVDRIREALQKSPGSSQEQARVHRSPGGGDTSQDRDRQPNERSPGAEASQRANAGKPRPGATDDPQQGQDNHSPQPEPPQPEKMTVAAAAVNGFSRFASALATRIEGQPRNVTPSWFDRAMEQTNARTAARAERDMDATAQLGSEAVEAMRNLRSGPGSSIMAAIHDAAGNDPDGVRGVLSQMKPGGRYETLHSQLTLEKSSNREFARQFEEAASKVEAYGKGREAADQLGVQLKTSTRVEQRFAQIDAQVGAEAAALPGRKPGQSMLEDMTEKAQEAVKKAIELLQKIFRPAPSSGPSMSP
ncbi:hypothetical protein [Kozakia baliensis]|nr:hypothetical protein [Kozakia baliensis]GEL65661.1 hypothetical protein KBA01_29470 [Kozakia baliensis]